MAKLSIKNFSWKGLLGILVVAVIGIATGVGVDIAVRPSGDDVTIEATTQSLELSDEQVPAVLEDKGELVEDATIPTVEEVDGGLFKDADTGVSLSEGEYADLGWSETYNTSSPEAFKNDTFDKCVIANNYYGAQCVSLARVFWWSYADRDVSTCGTGMAKGMMNCAEQNAGDDFEVFWADDKDSIQAGDWLIFSGGQYGHVGMALGPVSNGYVALLGENQGGHSCGAGVGGSAANIVNISVKNLIGGYRPKAYIAPEPTPEPAPSDDEVAYTYVKGDYFSKVLVKLGLDEGKLWGEDGTVAYYTAQLIAQGVLDNRGNVRIGVPFTLTRR